MVASGDVIVTVAWYTPGVSDAALAVMTTTVGVLDAENAAVSQPAPLGLTVAVSPVSRPPPSRVTATGNGPDADPRNTETLSAVVPTTSVGALPTLSVTAMVTGLLLATGDESETVAVYVPAASTSIVGRSVSVAGAVC